MKIAHKKSIFRLCLIILFLAIWESLVSGYVEKLSKSFHELDPLLIWRPRPGKIGVNSLGLRNSEFDPRKMPGEIRVIILGDSSIYGHGVNDDETSAYHLENILREKFPDRVIKVLNAGVNGYSSLQGKYFFEELLPKVNPDLVIIGYFHSDIKMERQEDAAIVHKNFLTGIRRLLYKSKLYLLLRKEIGLVRYSLSKRAEMGQQDNMTCHRVCPSDYGKNLGEITEKAQQRGAKVIFLKMQYPAMGFPAVITEETLQSYFTEIEEAASRTSSHIVDLRSTFMSYKPEEMYIDDYFHPSSYGNLMIAKQIFQCIKDNNLMGSK